MTEQSAVTVEIKNRWTCKVMFSAEIGLDIEKRFRVQAAVRLAVRQRTNLRDAYLCGADLRGADLCGANLCGADLCDAYLCGADLCGASLRGADLRGANLRGANLRDANLRDAYLRDADLCDAYLCGADLRGADLCGANLCGADLCGADLRGADLCGANLCGADLCGAKITAELSLVGARPYFTIGPIGSESRYFIAWITNQGLRLQAGCFFGTRDEFISALDKRHGDGIHGKEYRAALASIDAHVEIWSKPGEEAA